MSTRINLLGSLALAAVLSAAVTACSGSDGSSVFSNGQHDDGSGNQPPTGNLSGPSSPSGTMAACVTSVVGAEITPVNMVVMFDKSGSMGDKSEGFDPTLKWNPVTTGMKAFFSDPNSAGLAASLQFFPEGGDLASVCAYPYANPMVQMATLTNPAAILGAIDATAPNGARHGR
jgi:hypothetical protein